MRRIHRTDRIDGKHAEVYYCHDWCEYVVKFYNHGKHQKRADYHTDDRQDAIDTAEYQTAGVPA